MGKYIQEDVLYYGKIAIELDEMIGISNSEKYISTDAKS